LTYNLLTNQFLYISFAAIIMKNKEKYYPTKLMMCNMTATTTPSG